MGAYGKPIQRVLQTVLAAIPPSFLSPSSPRHKPISKIHPTAYLSGIRGIAAVIVCFTHYVWHEYRAVRYGYLSNVPANANTFSWGYKKEYEPKQHIHIFLQLPFLRVLVSAPAMVRIFFIVSGFSISYSSIKAIRRNEQIRLYQGLSSSVFRRGFRLYLPVLFYTFWTETWAGLGLYNYPFVVGRPDRAGSSISARLVRIWYTFQNTIFQNKFKNASSGSHYNGQLWTIPIEFQASLVVYTVIVALACFQIKYRLFFQVLVAMEITYGGSPYTALFMYGLILAELHHLRVDWEKESGHTTATYLQARFGLPAQVTQGFWMAVALVGLYMTSCPENPAQSVGYEWLASLSGNGRVHTGCVLFILGVDHSMPFQNLFNSRLAQYLGDISYSLYIVHMWILQAFRNPIMSLIEVFLPGASLSVLMVLQAFITVPLNVWIADLFWRTIDENCVSLAKSLFTSFLYPAEGELPS